MYKITGGDKKVYGPVNENELRRWIAEGRLNAQSLVQPEGAAEWQPLGTFPEFADALGAREGALPSAPAPAQPINAEAFSAEILARQPAVQIGRACRARGACSRPTSACFMVRPFWYG